MANYKRMLLIHPDLLKRKDIIKSIDRMDTPKDARHDFYERELVKEK